MKVMIAGGSGLIGRALSRSLVADGHQVWILTRNPGTLHMPGGVQAVPWDGKTVQGWVDQISQMDAVVNFSGESLAHWPWTEERKKRFVNSRVQPARLVVEAMKKVSPRPSVYLQASAIGYYGPRQDPVTEKDMPGNDFSARLCMQWEEAAGPIKGLGVRLVLIRTSVVLSPDNVILRLMSLPVRAFFGGPLGNGRQGFSWIHIEDEVAAIRFLLQNKKAHGAFNLSSPEPMSSAEFIRTIARVLQRPFWFPVPAFLLGLVLGGMSTLVLDGQFVFPEKLRELGFKFKYETAESALRNIFHREA